MLAVIGTNGVPQRAVLLCSFLTQADGVFGARVLFHVAMALKAGMQPYAVDAFSLSVARCFVQFFQIVQQSASCERRRLLFGQFVSNVRHAALPGPRFRFDCALRVYSGSFV